MSIQAVLTNLVLRWQFKRAGRGPLNVKKARSKINQMARRYPPPPKEIRHTPVPAQPDQGLCPAEWLSVANPKRTVVYFHGGGYFFCGLETHRPTCAYLARTAEAKVLSVDYRLAPEHVFPAAVDDALAWWKALLAQGVDPKNVVFGGDSAGGGLALACLLAAKAEGLPLPAGAVLFSPWTDLSCSGETMRSLADADVMFNPESLPEAAALYLAGKPTDTPLASPLFADLTGLPPLLIYASEHEILLSDSTRLHERAKAQGVRSTLHLKPKMPHVWPTMLVLPEARQTLKECGDFIAQCTR
ncbi:alpha/beta hydrolase fold domain-containing protein [Aquabacterium fontiphilum]|uniref:alpha/beta hydrolase n=1 Tax=Aquabacterium fontiphilum TaxID=450365 RepID=UPI0013767A21|nr:alpha/beta hydrolase [Aquabacterium fontiphilum]NBD19662.1 alpha/beta hydrolase fold domain-containing protein [Aquabacterium fontiphilum]